MRSLPTPHLLIQNGHTVSRDGLWPSPFHADFPYSFVQNNAARAATPPLQATPNRLPRNLPGLREARRSYTAGQVRADHPSGLSIHTHWRVGARLAGNSVTAPATEGEGEGERGTPHTLSVPRRKPQILNLECPRPTDL